jgi:hypothetical protein
MLPSSLAFNMVQMGANTYQKLHFRLLNSPLNPSEKKKRKRVTVIFLVVGAIPWS